MKKRIEIIATSLGLVLNLGLFFTKLYVGISINSLSIYCDAINNLGDTFACLIAAFGFLIASKMAMQKSLKLQSLCTFVINIFIAVTGVYFIYNGLERFMYPLKIAYSVGYAYIITITVFVKIAMGFMFMAFNKKANSPVLKALVLDSFLDCAITVFVLIGLLLIGKLNLAVDGIFAIITGTIISISAIKGLIEQAKYLINN